MRLAFSVLGKRQAIKYFLNAKRQMVELILILKTIIQNKIKFELDFL